MKENGPGTEMKKEDKKLTGKEIESFLKKVTNRLSLGKLAEDKLQALLAYVESEGEGYLLESEL